MLQEAWESAGPDLREPDAPDLLSDAMAQLIEMLERLDRHASAEAATAAEINTLGEYGMHLLEDLARLAERVEQQAIAREFEQLCLPYALWIARQGGELRNLRPVVNALARVANQASRPNAMAALHGQCCELIEATSPSVPDSFSGDPQHPWRLLLLNRAIVATRSHNPDLIEASFDAIVEGLPADARQFFAEAMEQMALLDYPDPVRDIVRRYYAEHAAPRHLH